jgi:uncharacterized membrane protein
MLELLAGPVTFSESTGALITLVVGAVVILPVYFICILIAYLLRKKVRIHPYPAALFLSCAPLALLSIGVVALFGSEETDVFKANDTFIGNLFGAVSGILLIIGLISFIIIILQAITERKSKNNSNNPPTTGRVTEAD